MLVGRHREQQAIAALAAGARVGQSGVLVVVGEAGSGKSALLDAASGSLQHMQVCRVVGSEAERDLGFGGLSQLVGSGADLTDLPTPQARALEVALNLRVGSDVDRFAVGAGTLGVLSHRAESGALAVLIDDAHLLDHSSAEAITFAARRLLADPVLLVAAVRAGEDSPLLQAGLPIWELAGLDTLAAQELLALRTGQHVPAGQVERLVRATGGNPLALLELGADPDRLHSLGPHDPIAVGPAVTRAFLTRTERLSPPARAALLVAACSGGDPLVVRSACAVLDIDPSLLTEAVDAELLTPGPDMGFGHPLVRAAVLGAATPERLREVHAALARATPDPDGRAWHLAAAAVGPDPAVAAALDSVAQRARSRSAHDVAATALHRAGWLSGSVQERSARLVAAAESAWLGGQGGRALALLAEIGQLEAPAVDVDLVARAGHLRGTILSRTGSIQVATEVFREAALRVQRTLPEAAVELWADGVNAAFFRGDTGFLHEAADALDTLARRATSARGQVLGDLARGMALTLVGQPGADLIRRAVEQLATGDTLRADPLRAEWLVLGPLYLREEGRYRTLVRAALAETREAAALGELARLLFLVALDDAATDHWSRGHSEYHESIQLARAAGHANDLTLALAGLAWLEARMGRDQDCRVHAEESLALCRANDITIGRIWCGLALGELELGAGRPEQALVHLDEVDHTLQVHGLHDMDLDPAPERAEGLLRLGRAEEARDAIAQFHRLSTAKGQAWALARAERALGALATEDEADHHFAVALELHATTPDTFETARTQLAHGSSLRRRRRRRDARAPLRAALAAFEELGAEQRAEQAAVELAATGETVQRRGASRLTTLTAQERQIAELLCDGATTRQAAAALFLSPKTVEYHLRHVYTKLAVRSRGELSEALRGP
ncbi:helix-turn-helix transcriptional regulator [Ornithinimicrobium murale]|uniref:helix-turn-helix transcriptional regulator n=1 Tax=Ornithinimicrobium murale TaxID=1050153 RepID=UPI000E0D2068|nr:LuxR family transcriptional regulator [Ornithinimicrobium murale]